MATTTVRHHAPIDVHHACQVEASLITTDHATEVFARIAPEASGTSRNACDVQTRVVYEALAAMLQELNAELDHVVIEKAFFRNLPADHDDFDQLRLEFYRKQGITNGDLPAVTHIGQSPCQPGVDVELQVYAVVPTSSDSVNIQSLPAPREGAAVKLLEVGPARQLFISNLTGHGLNGDGHGTFREQSQQVFQAASDALEAAGGRFSNVLRTWFYLDEIDADYAELNAARNAFYETEALDRLPASTGIGGSPHPAPAAFAADFFALLNPEIAQLSTMTTPLLNEATDYGSAFSRGVKMALPQSTYLFLSATPSADEKGETVHPGGIRGQIERVLLNIEELLKAQNASFSDLAQAVTYMRSADDLELFQEICTERGIVDVPHTVVSADICRSDFLLEMETIAIVATQPAEED